MLIKDSRFNNPHPIKLEVGRYPNGNIAIEGIIMDPGFSEPWCKYTVNMDIPLPETQVALKVWSENEAIEQVLWEANVIEDDPVSYIYNGFVEAPVYNLTQYALNELKLGGGHA